MPDRNPTRVDAGDLRMAQRAVVLQLLRDDHDPRWTRVELEAEASDLDPQAVRDGLARLEAEGAVTTAREYVIASRCVRHLDALELVSV
jgi:hypothetical protein